MNKQLKLEINPDDIEIFCPSCWTEETFTETTEFTETAPTSVHCFVCCRCGFPTHVEFADGTPPRASGSINE